MRRNKPTIVKRILEEFSGKNKCSINICEVLESLPMTINLMDVKVEAVYSKGKVFLTVYCNETIKPGEQLGGVYEVEEK